MRITVLTENTSRCGLACEHGLSLFIETQGRRLLFDSGQSELFAENAARLGINLGTADTAVLSHGHYDHGGGLRRFLELNHKARVYMSRFAFEPHYNGEKYIGLDKALEDSDRIVLTEGVTPLGEGITLYDCLDCEAVVPIDSAGLSVLQNGAKQPEDFRHEHYLLIVENGKRILFSGCSHRGALNIVNRFRPDVLIGGFHLMKHPIDDALIDYARRLDGCPVEYYTCHCTGEEQYAAMKPHMRRLHYLSTGDTAEL